MRLFSKNIWKIIDEYAENYFKKQISVTSRLEQNF